MDIFKPSKDLVLTKLASFPEFDPSPIVEIELDGRVTYLNPTARELFPDLETKGLDHQFLSGVADIVAGIRQRDSRAGEREIEARGRWFKQVIYCRKTENRIRIHGIDISDIKKREEILKSRLALSEFAINNTEDDLLMAALDEAERLTDSSIGFFHYVDEDQLNLSLQMWSTNTIRNMCSAEGKGTHYPINKAGVWAECFYRKEPVIHNDYESLAHKKGLPEGHAPVIRELVVPVVQGEKVVAILGVGNKKTVYNESDVETVSVFANLVWDVVMRKRREQEILKLTAELQASFAKVKKLSGMLPICANCKRIGDDKGYWKQIESYIREHSEAEFSHGICPECFNKLYPEFRKP